MYGLPLFASIRALHKARKNEETHLEILWPVIEEHDTDLASVIFVHNASSDIDEVFHSQP